MIKTLDKILIGCATFLLLFTVVMIVIFCVFQAVPDTLIDAVYGLLGGEVVVTFFIWYIKKRYARKYEREDKQDEFKE